MIKRLSWLACAVLLLMSSNAARALDRSAVTFTDYQLEMRLLPDQQSIDVSGKITVRNDAREPQKAIALQVSSSFEWMGVRLNGQPVNFVAQDYPTDLDHTGAVREAIVTLAEPLAPGASLTFTVHYAGFAGYDATVLTELGADESSAAKTLWDQVGDAFTVFRGLGHVTWYPVSIDAQSLRDGDSLFRTLNNWRARHSATPLKLINGSRMVAPGDSHEKELVVSNADASNCKSDDVCTLVFHLGDETPILALGAYNKLDLAGVSIYALADETQRARSYGEAAVRDIKLLAPWFGAPHKTLSILSIGDDPLQAFDANGLLITPFRNKKEAELDVELARSVSSVSFVTARPWLREGAADLAQGIIYEQQGGRGYMLGMLNRYIASLTYLEDAPAAAINESSSKAAAPAHAHPLVDAADPVMLSAKGGFVLQMLRDLIGDAAMKQTLTAYNAAEDRTPEYFEQLAERFGKRNLHAFFADWVYADKGLARLRLVSAYPHQNTSVKGDTQPSWTVTLTVANDGDTWVETPVTVRYSGGDRSERLIVEPHKEAVVRVISAAAPVEAVVNDGSIPEASVAEHVIKFEAK